jgi:pyrroline-5-carboxylate reductase
LLRKGVEKMKVGIIGVGNIGSIIADLLIEKGHELHLVNRHVEKLRKYEGRANTYLDIEKLPEVDVLFLCVKPQDALQALKRIPNSSKRITISTVAGLTINEISSYVGERIVRIMPNIPISIGKGVIGIAYDEKASLQKEKVEKLLSPFGKLVQVNEYLFPAVTALSGSGPAFIFVIIEALVDAGMKLGLSYETSMNLVLETMKGSAELLQHESKHPGEFRHIVTSPAGTTIEGIYSLERQGLRGILMKTIFDTYKRALELQED